MSETLDAITAYVSTTVQLRTLQHPNKSKFPNQRIWVVKVRGYAHLVPFVEPETEIFLKTIIPSRKATKQFIGEVDDES